MCPICQWDGETIVWKLKWEKGDRTQDMELARRILARHDQPIQCCLLYKEDIDTLFSFPARQRSVGLKSTRDLNHRSQVCSHTHTRANHPTQRRLFSNAEMHYFLSFLHARQRNPPNKVGCPGRFSHVPKFTRLKFLPFCTYMNIYTGLQDTLKKL